MEFSQTFWTVLEYFGVASGLLYLYYELRQKPQMWVLGLISSGIYILVFAMARIYADMCFNVYNVLISIYGLNQWRLSLRNQQKQTAQTRQVEYYHTSSRVWCKVIASSLLLYGAIYYLLRTYTDSPIPLGDALTTSLSIVATWMLAKRYLSHWLVWVVINVASIWLYYQRGLYPTMILYAFYAAAAVFGYFIWKKNGIGYREK